METQTFSFNNWIGKSIQCALLHSANNRAHNIIVLNELSIAIWFRKKEYVTNDPKIKSDCCSIIFIIFDRVIFILFYHTIYFSFSNIIDCFYHFLLICKTIIQEDSLFKLKIILSRSSKLYFIILKFQLDLRIVVIILSHSIN